MTISEQQKLAAELTAMAPITDWSVVPELVEMQVELPPTGVIDKPRILDFQQAADLYKQLDAEIEQRNKLKERLKEAMQAAMMVSGKDKVRVGDWVPTMVTKEGTKKIVAEKLLANGVDPMVIAASTEVGKGSTYLMIRAAKDK